MYLYNSFTYVSETLNIFLGIVYFWLLMVYSTSVFGPEETEFHLNGCELRDDDKVMLNLEADF